MEVFGGGYASAAVQDNKQTNTEEKNNTRDFQGRQWQQDCV